MEIIKHCDFQIKKYKKEVEEKMMDKNKLVVVQKKAAIGNIFKGLIVDKMLIKPLERKIQQDKQAVMNERDKKDYERSTWWMDDQTNNAKMRNWVNKHDKK